MFPTLNKFDAMTIQDFAADYVTRVGGSAGYAEQMRVLTKRLHWETSELTVARIDSYLTTALTKLAGTTVNNHRRMLNTLRKAAIADGVVVDECTRPIRRVKATFPAVRAWSHDEIKHLISVAQTMTGNTFACPLNIFMPAYIVFAYTSGLRLGDMLAIRYEQIRGHRLSLVLQKTRQQHVCVLTDQSLAALEALPRRGDGRIFGALVSRRQFINHFRLLVRSAKLPGSAKFLRRSSATYAEISGIDATGHLGHLTADMKRRYLDLLILSEHRRAVPPLVLG
jgi:integrase